MGNLLSAVAVIKDSEDVIANKIQELPEREREALTRVISSVIFASKSFDETKIPTDMLETLFSQQRDLMRRLGVVFPGPNEEYLDHPSFRSAIDGVVTEGAEVLDAVSVLTKPWKRRPLEEVRDHVIEEAVDVMFMLVEVFILARLEPQDVLLHYNAKWLANLGRLEAAKQRAST